MNLRSSALLLFSFVTLLLQGMDNKKLVVTWGASTAKNKRPYQEDRFLCKKNPDGSLCIGVFDGHGGGAVADFVKDKLPSYFQKSTPELIGEKFTTVFRNIDNALKSYWYWWIRSQGTTAVVAHIDPNKKAVHLINTGDSRAALENGDTIQATDDHKPFTYGFSDKVREEVERIKENGGVIRGGTSSYVFPSESSDYGLAVTRALGDHASKQVNPRVIIPDPDTKLVQLSDGSDSFLVLASDGLWNVMSTTDVFDVIKKHSKKSRADLESVVSSIVYGSSVPLDQDRSNEDENNNLDLIARLLISDASFLRGSTDNITVVIAKLEQKDSAKIGPNDSWNDSKNKSSLIPSYHRPGIIFSVLTSVLLSGLIGGYLKYFR